MVDYQGSFETRHTEEPNFRGSPPPTIPFACFVQKHPCNTMNHHPPSFHSGSHSEPAAGSTHTGTTDTTKGSPAAAASTMSVEEELENEAAMSSLDHALLESIFYNEMMLLDDPNDDTASLISSSLLSTLSADGSVREPLALLSRQQQQHAAAGKEAPPNGITVLDRKPQALPLTTTTTTTTTGYPATAQSYPPSFTPQQQQQQPPATNGMASTSSTTSMPVQASVHHSLTQQQHVTAPGMNPHSQPAAAAPSTVVPTTGLTATTASPYAPPGTTMLPGVVPTATATGFPLPNPLATTGEGATASLPQPTDAPSDASVTSLEGEKRQKLVSQFASLASRLGIALPQPVVHSLGGKASVRGTTLTANPTLYPTTTTTTTTTTTVPPPALATSTVQHGTTLVGAAGEPPAPGSYAAPSMTNPPVMLPTAEGAAPTAASLQNGTTTQLPPDNNSANNIVVVATPEVQQLAQAADAAVASVVGKRVASETDLEVLDSQPQPPPQSLASSSSSNKQAPYSRRRKKPRLQDCESKLAELQAENDMLKRHLANLSSQSHALDQERLIQEQRMRIMLEQGGSEDELDNAVKHFSDMYSDYGRRRHQELSFHLDQLTRLANPTNFTKLGLWTMGQQNKNSRNSIAGILQKELGISVQQGKKILEQRKRIQHVCSNLKEVRCLVYSCPIKQPICMINCTLPFSTHICLEILISR